ncbi:MAG: hypothetical protein COA44_02880 [Arcobacter sp.]|nr:MAG: hypothetical protein COA44_02880 [Arcobacter sp.]
MTDGRHWPIGIIAATTFIVCACAATIYIALLQPVQEDADMMQSYQELNNNANDIIVAGIMFNRKYQLTYTGEAVSEEGSTLSYTLVDTKGKAVNNAKFEVILTRPILEGFEITLAEPKIENGNYIFEDVKVNKKGRWNILTKVSVGNDFRHMNLKSDTMDKGVYEYGFDKPMRNAGANN